MPVRPNRHSLPRACRIRRLDVRPDGFPAGAHHEESAPLNGNDDLRRQNEALRRRISQLGAASLRIGSSLDLDTVLGEIVESARALTGARYAGIATIDESGKPVDFVTSGFTADEHRAIEGWSDGPRLFEHLRDLVHLVALPDRALRGFAGGQ